MSNVQTRSLFPPFPPVSSHEEVWILISETLLFVFQITIILNASCWNEFYFLFFMVNIIIFYVIWFFSADGSGSRKTMTWRCIVEIPPHEEGDIGILQYPYRNSNARLIILWDLWDSWNLVLHSQKKLRSPIINVCFLSPLWCSYVLQLGHSLFYS